LANRGCVYDAVGPDWMSKKEIAMKLKGSISETTVGVHLTALVDEGKISRIGENRTTRYRRPPEGEKSLFGAVKE
jgi:hypothetical protein